eukprot:13003479-Ditylum_brightwellii.AAC.1
MGIKPALSGRVVRNCELMRSTFCRARFSCALDGQRLNLLPSTSDMLSFGLSLPPCDPLPAGI